MSDDNTNGQDLLIALTRLEAKVDVVLAQHGADLRAHGQDLADHEARLRVIEQKPTVSPRVLWTVTASAITLICAVVGTLFAIFN